LGRKTGGPEAIGPAGEKEKGRDLGRGWAKEKGEKRDREGEFEGGFGTLGFLCFFSFLSFSTHINQKQKQQNKCNTYTHLFYLIKRKTIN
jgi:hypothetical protein